MNTKYKKSTQNGYRELYIYNGILFSHKKKEILPFITTWMDLEGIMLSEINQTEKDKYCMVSLLSGIGKKKKENRFVEKGLEC